MAELLLYAKNTKTDPFDPPLGAIVNVKPNGFKWGRMASIETWVSEGNNAADFPDDFVILKLPNLSPNGKLKEYVEQHHDYNIVLGRNTAQYKWRIPINLLPAALLTELQNNRVATRNYTISQIKAYIQNKVTEAFEA